MPRSKKDERLLAISDLLAQYSMGVFDSPSVELSNDLDEIDSIISGVNMLGQELKSTTVSRDFFANIYNTVSNILIVTDEDYKIINLNKTSLELLNYQEEDLLQRDVFEVLKVENPSELKKIILNKELKYKSEIDFIKKGNSLIPTNFNCTTLLNPEGEPKGFLIIAEDLTDKKNREREILKKITETQENERTRVADDLHDSLGQELASIRMMLAGITYQMDSKNELKERIEDCTELLDSSINNIREICFDLIPNALSSGELIIALRQVVRKIETESFIHFDIFSEYDKTELEGSRQTAVFRVFQEFVHNSIKHAECSKIQIEHQEENKNFELSISDDGIGFKRFEDNSEIGRGLSTMISRIEALNGKAKMTSVVGEGTKIKINFTIANGKD